VTVSRLLIANRGEVAVRVARSAAEMGITTVAIYGEDDATSMHVRAADSAELLPGAGAAAYLDIEQVIAAGLRAGCDAVHPGWGFLSENQEFARRCVEAGLVFVGPAPETLAALGDKTQAKAIAKEHSVPTVPGSAGPVTVEEARAFFAALPSGAEMIIKAVAGGGGRGMRVVANAGEVDTAYARCQSEAARAFGDGSLYVEQRMPRARHIEIQVIGDGTGAVTHLWERDCSLQRRHQKVVEIAPSPVLHPELRQRLAADAVRMASANRYRGAGTFEFLVATDGAGSPGGAYAFIEANPRLQVEHTVTEEVLGIDLVKIQLRIAGGATLSDLNLTQDRVPAPRGHAIQFRVNAEEIRPDGTLRPSVGLIEQFDTPSGPGIRLDTFACSGYRTSPAFDSLLAKLVVHAPAGFDEVVARSRRALREFRVGGLATNIAFLRNLVDHPAFVGSDTYTTFVDENVVELAAPREDDTAAAAGTPTGHTAGAKVDAVDPLAVLVYGKSRTAPATAAAPEKDSAEPGAILAPMQSTVVSFEVAAGDEVRKGQDVAVLNAMKMEHVLKAPVGGVVRRLNAAPGDTIVEGQVLLVIEPSAAADDGSAVEDAVDLELVRPDLAQVLDRHFRTTDAARPATVAKRHETGHRTARENVADLCDPGSFVEYGPLVLAADGRFTREQLIEKSPGDGMVVGIGTVNGDKFDTPASRCLVMSYDYMVFAGTQGGRNHIKTDRGIAVAKSMKLPLILFAEGGGGRAGGTSSAGLSSGGTRTFGHFAQLSGLVPLIGITTGRCYAGNASLLGCCDVIIATRDSNIGMGGPAMIEGGGLGVFAPEDIGPMDIQVPNGVVDIAVEDEAEAVAVAKQYLSYFQGPLKEWDAADQRALRHVVPENRLRVYDPRDIITTMADRGSVLEIRRGFGQGMIVAFARIEGRPIGIVANDPQHYGGAITSDGSDKAARFMQLCDGFDIPILFLCDTPGIMVGPEIEKTALVRHSSRMFITGANVSVPCMTIIVRKAYGLGAIAMANGSYKEPLFTVAWPTGEFGGMGLEGQVKLGFRNELAAISDPEARRQKFDEMVAAAYERGKALNSASGFGIDDTIDPADSRRWVSAILQSVRPPQPRTGKKRAAIDAW